MARHLVSFTIPERRLGKADVEFAIRRDGDALGRLKVSNGTVVWVPKNKSFGFKLDWIKFDALMQEYGAKEK